MRASLRRLIPGPWSLGVPVIALLAVLLFSISAVTARGTDLRADRRTEVTQLIDQQQQTVADQQQRLQRLHNDLVAAGAGLTDPRLADAKRRAASVAEPAGLTALRGPGLTVVLDD